MVLLCVGPPWDSDSLSLILSTMLGFILLLMLLIPVFQGVCIYNSGKLHCAVVQWNLYFSPIPNQMNLNNRDQYSWLWAFTTFNIYSYFVFGTMWSFDWVPEFWSGASIFRVDPDDGSVCSFWAFPSLCGVPLVTAQKTVVWVN